MKTINRISGALKALGWVIILIALALCIYVVSSDQSEWKKVNDQLKASGVSTGIKDRLHFDDSYYAAMSEAQLSDVKAASLRNAAAREHFVYLEEKAADAAAEAAGTKKQELLTYLDENIDLETKEKLEAIPGTPPDMIIPPVGDAFAARNKYAMQIDFEKQPPQFKVSDTHWAATWLLHPNAPKVDPPRIVLERIERMKKLQQENSIQEGGQEE